MAFSPITPQETWGNSGNSERLYFGGFQNHCKSLQNHCSHEIKKTLAPWKKCYDQPRQQIKNQRHYFANKGPLVKAMVFPVVMYECEGWTVKKVEFQRINTFELWCWRRLLRVPWTARSPVHPKGNQSWIFIGRTDVEAEAPILWLPPDVKNWIIGKDPDAGKDWRREEKGMTEDEMVAWHHQLDGDEFEQAPGVGDGQGGLACCSWWGYKVRHHWMTELNWWQIC